MFVYFSQFDKWHRSDTAFAPLFVFFKQYISLLVSQEKRLIQNNVLKECKTYIVLAEVEIQ